MGLRDDHPVVVTCHDPSTPDRLGFQERNTVSVWCNDNRLKISPTRYMEVIDAAKANAFVSLCDRETPQGASSKRVAQAVTKSLGFLDDNLTDLDRAVITKGRDYRVPFVIGAVEGGFDGKAREVSCTKTKSRNVDAFLIDGLHSNGHTSLEMDMNEIRPLVLETNSWLPESKPRFFFGACDPLMVLGLVEAGIDVFDSSYVTLMTEKGKAMVFKNALSRTKSTGINCKRVSTTPKATGAPLTLDLNDKSFKEDFSPLCDLCTCYTCRKHTRAYVNHLLNTNELLAPLLLMIHNLHHFLTFFDTLRTCVRDGTLEDLKSAVIGHAKGPMIS